MARNDGLYRMLLSVSILSVALAYTLKMYGEHLRSNSVKKNPRK